MFVPLRHWNLTICAFVACFRSASTLTGSFPTEKDRTFSNISVKELSTFGIENLAHRSKHEVEQLVTASARAIPDSSEAREGKTGSTDQLEALRKQSESIANSNGEHVSRGSTQLASSYPEALNEAQRGSRTTGALVGPLRETSVSSKGEIGTIKSYGIRVPKTEMQKPVPPKSSEKLLKDRTPETMRQEIDPDGTVKAVPELQQSEEKVNELHSSAQVLPNGHSRTFVRIERKRTSQVGRFDLGGAENDEGVSLQAPQTLAVQQEPVQASALVVEARGGPPAVSTSSPPDSQRDSTFLGSLGFLIFWIVFIVVVALGSFWLGQRSAHRGSSNESSFQHTPSRSDGFSSKYSGRASIWSRASSRGRGSDDDASPSGSLQRHGVPRSPSGSRPLLQRLGVVRDSLFPASNKLVSFDVGDRVKVLKQTRLRGKTATVIDPCWRTVNGETMVQVRMDFKDEKGEIKSFKVSDLELIHIFQVGDKVKVMKETRLKGKTAVVIDPCWRKTNGFTLVQVKMDETDVKGDIKSFTQGDLAPALGSN